MKLDEHETLAGMIHRLAAWQTATMNRQLRTLGLNTDQANVIRYVGAHPGVNQQTVARLLSRNVASLTNLLKSLETKKLIERRYEDGDVRTKHLLLTANGQQINERVQQCFDKLDDQVNQVLPAEVQAATSEAIETLVKQLVDHA
ncbi:MarR family winged helix-turn-helix transcriptional regulator [Furfurilactobacillus milii]|uniref:MarR family transcriptional regulator n=1 Tax=Furfurilactobacillus milii TaxID=2888272 RepID=A0A6N9I2D0_9LACO|nr:MarR family transcriptional regulator [Furfurilactobacillus milii]MYV17151.1 MarR family transcriptional regulator [Furfurilactobacillus milii]